MSIQTTRVETIDARKHALRIQLRRLRSGSEPFTRMATDRAISERLCALPAFIQAETLLTYLSFGSEVDTHAIIERAWKAGKTVAIPRCQPDTHTMRWYRIESFDGLVRSDLGMEEPAPQAECELEPATGCSALAIVPGLAFDRAGYRLGYGAGYYDRFLAGFQGTSVGLCREVQLRESLLDDGVIDTHDRRVDIVVTERRSMSWGRM